MNRRAVFQHVKSSHRDSLVHAGISRDRNSLWVLGIAFAIATFQEHPAGVDAAASGEHTNTMVTPKLPDLPFQKRGLVPFPVTSDDVFKTDDHYQ